MTITIILLIVALFVIVGLQYYSMKEGMHVHDDTDVSGGSVDALPTQSMSKQEKSALIRDIQKAVKNELLSDRAFLTTRQSLLHNPNEYGAGQSPDMSDYIKKDSIPCWGCNLD